MRKKVLTPAPVSKLKPSVLDNARIEYLNDPWKAASSMPDEFLEYFPKASQFRIGQLLLSLLCLDHSCYYCEHLEEYFAEYVANFSLIARNKIIRAVKEYYAARGDVFRGHDYGQRLFVLPEVSQDLMPRHIGLEIEVDDGSSDNNGLRDSLHEIRTSPTRDKQSLKRFLCSMQDILFILDDLGLIPLGYELSVHVNVDARMDCIDLLKPDVPLQSFIMQICLPNISQARLERYMELDNTGRFSLGYRYGYNLEFVNKFDHSNSSCRLHMPMFEVSPTFDVDYFIFACEVLGKATDNNFVLSAFEMLEKANSRFLRSNNLNCLVADSEYFLSLPWLKYHELMYDLRREMMKAFGEK